MSELFKDRAGEQSSLFVIWANGRHREREILQDIRERFEVLRVFEVSWSPDKVAENYQRFYGDIDVRGIYHRFSKGPGPFIAITLVDHSPVMEERMTSRGPRMVNGRFLDAKTLYREWAGELTIHCTENEWETDRDVFMLFGEGMAQHRSEAAGPWSGKVDKVIRDLTGADGWTSEEELFAALNRAVEYALVTSPDCPPFLVDGAEINILAADGRALHTILRARPREPSQTGGSFRVQIGGSRLLVGLRHPGDGFFPTKFARQILRSRTLNPDGTFRPGDREAFGALAYHELVHRPAIAAGELERLLQMASRLGIPGWTHAAAANPQALHALLAAELDQTNCEFERPLDAMVYFNRSIAGLGSSLSLRARDALARNSSRFSQQLKYFVSNIYWQIRDQLLMAAPGIRVIKRWVTG